MLANTPLSNLIPPRFPIGIAPVNELGLNKPCPVHLSNMFYCFLTVLVDFV
jgi:hypothetical protein